MARFYICYENYEKWKQSNIFITQQQTGKSIYLHHFSVKFATCCGSFCDKCHTLWSYSYLFPYSYKMRAYNIKYNGQNVYIWMILRIGWIDTNQKKLLRHLGYFIDRVYIFFESDLFWGVAKNIERHTAHTTVSWPNPKQWVIIHTLMMMIRQSIYIISVITKEMGRLKAHSPIYCIMDNWMNMLHFTLTLNKIYLTGIL